MSQCHKEGKPPFKMDTAGLEIAVTESLLQEE